MLFSSVPSSGSWACAYWLELPDSGLLDATGLLQRISLPATGHCLGCVWVRFSPLVHKLCLLFHFGSSAGLIRLAYLDLAMDPNSLGEALSLHFWATSMLWCRDGLLVIGLLVAAQCSWVRCYKQLCMLCFQKLTGILVC
jgi:hypothetical protein